MRIIANVIVIILTALTLQSCFTGVESTPRITAGDVSRAATAVTPEETYFDSVTAMPFSSWKPGKKFYVTDQKIRLLFGTTLAPSTDLTGSVISYAGARESRSITGAPVTDLLFTSPLIPADTLAYRITATPAELNRKNFRPEIPFTIELHIIDKARELLQGKRFYIMTRNWRTADDRITPGPRFVAVTIDSVTTGTDVNPIRISFTTDDGRRSWLLLASGDSSASPRTFASMFSFTDPRKRYPAVTDDNWALIREGRVTAGMTREEVRLALGKPASVDRAPGYNYLHEMWTYENGIYLIFEDGLLTSFRR